MEPQPNFEAPLFDIPAQEPRPESRADRYARELSAALRSGIQLDPTRLAELVHELSVSVAASERASKAFQQEVERTLVRFMNTPEGDIFVEEIPREKEEEASEIVIRYLEEHLDTLSLHELLRGLQNSSGLRRSHHLGGHQLFDPNPQVVQLRLRILAKLFHHEPVIDTEVEDFYQLTHRALNLNSREQHELRYSPDALKKRIEEELQSV